MPIEELEARRAEEYQGFLELIARAKHTGHPREVFRRRQGRISSRRLLLEREIISERQGAAMSS